MIGDFSHSGTREIAKEALAFCHSYVDNFDRDGGNLILIGMAGVGKTFRSRSTSRFKVALNDSARALSALVPTAPMDWRTPSWAQWSLNACEVYTLP